MSIDQRNIMSNLRMMPDADLRRYAEMHKKNPYIFPLAFQESQDRQQMRAGQQAQMAGMEQPKTVDVALNAMGPRQAMPAPRLPEEQGIGALPAKNLQRMADGGIVGYADRGAVTDDTKVSNADQLEREAESLRMLQTELSRAKDPATIETLQREIQRVQYRINKGDPHARVPSLGKRITAALPIGSAEAAPAPQPPQMTQGGVDLSQIPGSGAAPAAVDSRSIAGKAADYIGVPEEWQRNINNTLTFLGGWNSPVAAVRGVNAASKGLEPTAEMLAKAQQAEQVANTVRVAPPAKAGIAALDATAQGTREAAETARRLRLLAQDKQAATGARQSVDAATKTANIARGIEDAATAKNTTAALNSQKLANTARGAIINQAIDSGGIADVAANQKPMRQAEEQHEGATPLTKKEEAKIKDMVKEEVPASQRKGWSGEDILMFGLQMMAGKSQYAMQNIGEAGIATLANRQAQLKAETERGKTASDIKEAGQRGKWYEAQATSLESGEKLDAAAKAKAADTAVKLLGLWTKSAEGMGSTAEQQRQMYNTYYAQALAGAPTEGFKQPPANAPVAAR
jgi:hypothetical protein